MEGRQLASNARIFFAGVSTTFAILAIGFGGGVLLAKSALHDPSHQARASSEPPSGMRVILPMSAEPALPVSAMLTTQPQTQPEIQPVAMTEVEKQIEKADVKKAERDAKVERRRQAERKARRIAAEQARQIARKVRPEPSIMAFGGDESRPTSLEISPPDRTYEGTVTF
jgi:hypothetical protein